MTTAILIPVLDRPARIEPLLNNIEAVTPEPHSIIFAASDQPTIDELDRLDATYIRDKGDSWPVRINRLYRATTAPYVFLGADDVQFFPGWLEEALEAMRAVDGVVAVADLYNPAGTLALVSRRYIDEEGGSVDAPGMVLYEGYRHNWSDTELFEVAKSRGRHAYCAAAIAEHLHPLAGKGRMDSTYAIGFGTEPADHAHYRARQHLWERKEQHQ